MSNRKTNMADLPVPVLAEIFSRLPHPPAGLAMLCTSFHEAMQDLPCHRTIDLIPGLPVDADPAAVPVLHPLLRSPVHRSLNADQLFAVRLPCNLPASTAIPLLCKVVGCSPKLRKLALTDDGVLQDPRTAGVLKALPKITSLEVHRASPTLLGRLHEASGLQQLVVTGLDDTTLPFLSGKLDQLPKSLRRLSLSIGNSRTRSAQGNSDETASFLSSLTAADAAFAKSLTDFSLCIHGRAVSVPALTERFENLWGHVNVTLFNPPRAAVAFPSKEEDGTVPGRYKLQANVTDIIRRIILGQDDFSALRNVEAIIIPTTVPIDKVKGLYDEVTDAESNRLLKAILQCHSAKVLDVRARVMYGSSMYRPQPDEVLLRLVSDLLKSMPSLHTLSISSQLVYIPEGDIGMRELFTELGSIETLQLSRCCPDIGVQNEARFMYNFARALPGFVAGLRNKTRSLKRIWIVGNTQISALDQKPIFPDTLRNVEKVIGRAVEALEELERQCIDITSLWSLLSQ